MSYHIGELTKENLSSLEGVVFTVNEQTGCWIWSRGTSSNGYGLKRFRGKSEGVHRIIWMLFNSNIPDGMDVCHSCDRRACINPEHLFLGTRKENIKDSVEKGRHYTPFTKEERLRHNLAPDGNTGAHRLVDS